MDLEADVPAFEYIINKQWKLIRRIGSGSFGNVYFGIHIVSGEEVAVKLESMNTKIPQLLFETRVYNLLQDGTGLAKVKWFGPDGFRNQYNALVMDLLGPTLEDLFNFCGRRFTMKTVLMIAEQIICRLEFLHSKNLIHRDIKPENILMGLGRNCNKLYLIDFGLAKRYRDYRSKNHIAFREDRSLTGTARYMSMNSHAGGELSRRDDLESLGYMFMYFLRSQLPWQGMKAKNKKQKYERIYEKKVSTPFDSLCKGYPPEFNNFLTYSKLLKFEETPDYKYLRDEFRSLFKTLNFMWDYVFDWTLLKQKSNQGQQTTPIKIADLSNIKDITFKKI